MADHRINEKLMLEQSQTTFAVAKAPLVEARSLFIQIFQLVEESPDYYASGGFTRSLLDLSVLVAA